MPFGTIDKYTKDGLTLILEADGAELICDFPITDKVYAWMTRNSHQYKKGAVIEYSMNKGDKTIGKVNLAQQKPSTVQKSNQIMIDEKLKAAGVPPTGQINVPLTTAAPNTQTATIGMFDPAKVSKVSIGCTISIHNWENIKVEVEATDAETARKALIECLSVTIPAQSAVARECIDRYLKNVLIKA